MSQPTPYTPAADFSDDELANVGGRSTVRTAALDAEFSALQLTLRQVLAAMLLNQRDDGEIRDGRVKLHTLSSDVRAFMAAGPGVPRGPWVTATVYTTRDIVSQNAGTYLAATPHTAGVFADDLAAGKWLSLTPPAAGTAQSTAFLPSAALSATTVQAAIEEADTENRALSAAMRTDLASSAAGKGTALITDRDAPATALARSLFSRLRDLPVSAASFATLADAWASGATSLYLPAGTWVVSANATCSVPMILAPGAKVSPSTGVALAINAAFSAPLNQCFVGAGAITLARTAAHKSYGEWWGAVADGTATGNEVPVNKALTAHGDVQLLAGTYLQDAAIVVQGDSKRLTGAGNNATVLQTASATIDHVRIGGGASFTQFPNVSGFTTNRTVNPANPATPRDGAAGMRMTKVIRGKVSDVTVYNSYLTTYTHDTGACEWDTVLGVRNLGGSGDSGYGHYVEGEIASTLGFPTANASLSFHWCQMSFQAALGTSYGFYAKGAISDLFLRRPETGGATTGIHIEGDGGVVTGIDIQIQEPIIDGVITKGIFITGMGSYGSVTINGGYTSASPTATHLIDVLQSTGVSIAGGHQYISATGATACIGLSIRSSNQVSCSGSCQFKGPTFPVVLTAGFMCDVSHNTMMLRSAQPSIPAWISVTGGSNNVFLGNTMWSDAAAAKVTNGIVVDASAASCHIDVTGMRALNVVNKLRINGAVVSAVGASGTHFITGSFS